MTPGYAVIWRGKTCVTYFTGSDWSLDPGEARVFDGYLGARWAVRFAFGVDVVRCWT